jgi:hypothetical protein
MIKRKILIPLGALLVVCFIGSGLLKDDNSGALGVLSYAAWFGFLVLVLFFVAVAVMAIVRSLGRLGRSAS